MKRLIIDDLRDLPLEGTVVRNWDDAIELYENGAWFDEIYLDYDLGGRWVYETLDDNTIMPFVDYLVELALNHKEDLKISSDLRERYKKNGWDFPEYLGTPKLPIIFVHTQNPVGRQRIFAALDRYYEVKNVILIGPTDKPLEILGGPHRYENEDR